MTIKLQNKRIIDFCAKHPSFDIENTLLTFIDFIEETYSSTVPTLDSNLATQILTNLKSLQQQVQGIDSSISIKQAEYIKKADEIKREYIEYIKNILMSNTNEKIMPVIKEYNETFTNKILLSFKDLIPKENNSQTMYLQTFIKNIEQCITIEMNKGITKESINNMLSVIDQKFASILTHSENKITNVLNAMSETKKEDEKLHNKLDSMLEKLCSTEKGKVSESLLEFNLQAIFQNAEIKNVASTAHSGDFWLIRKDKPIILIENKNYDKKVYTEEVNKFLDNMKDNDLCGIIISQKTPIVHRDNFEIEIHNGNVAVYIHECNYQHDKIKIAVQIIDTFKNRIEKQKIENGTVFTIDTEILEKLNRDFQFFTIKKRQHIEEIKHMYDTLLKSADEMDVVSLNELLESHGILTNVKKYVCGKCNTTFPTKRGRDTHERQCTGQIKEKKKGIQCKYCEQYTPTIKGMKTHCKKVHQIDIDESELESEQNQLN